MPICEDIPKQIIVRIHLNVKINKAPQKNIIFFDKISYLDKLVKQNMKSRLCLHVDVSHMIHYKIPHVIIDSIKEIYKL